jgi:hypothetical protein
MELTRRSLLSFFGAAAVVGCAPAADEGASTGSGYSDEQRQATIKALMNVFLPGGGSPGAAEVGAYDALHARTFLPVAVALGLVPPLPDAWKNRLDDIDGLVKDLIVTELGAKTLLRHGLRKFESLPFADQTAIVADAAGGALARLYEYVRAATMIAFLSTPFTDEGLVAIGFAPYENFADDLHNSGSTDFTYDRVPTVDGRVPWSLTVDGDIA